MQSVVAARRRSHRRVVTVGVKVPNRQGSAMTASAIHSRWLALGARPASRSIDVLDVVPGIPVDQLVVGIDADCPRGRLDDDAHGRFRLGDPVLGPGRAVGRGSRPVFSRQRPRCRSGRRPRSVSSFSRLSARNLAERIAIVTSYLPSARLVTVPSSTALSHSVMVRKRSSRMYRTESGVSASR